VEKASPKVRNLLLNAREKYQIWKDNEKPDGQLKEGKIQAQQELRKQMRKEKFMDRQKGPFIHPRRPKKTQEYLQKT